MVQCFVNQPRIDALIHQLRNLTSRLAYVTTAQRSADSSQSLHFTLNQLINLIHFGQLDNITERVYLKSNYHTCIFYGPIYYSDLFFYSVDNILVIKNISIFIFIKVLYSIFYTSYIKLNIAHTKPLTR